ncbi:MAG: response regulator [Patescibacteria group bacterium]
MTKKILVIDDDSAIQQVIKSSLVPEGYDVRTADNGQAGLDLVKEFQPDVIMLDIMMPVMGGFDFLKQNKESTIPVIVLSSLGQDGNEEKVKALGVKYFLQKDNIHIDDIKKLISNILNSAPKQ